MQRRGMRIVQVVKHFVPSIKTKMFISLNVVLALVLWQSDTNHIDRALATEVIKESSYSNSISNYVPQCSTSWTWDNGFKYFKQLKKYTYHHTTWCVIKITKINFNLIHYFQRGSHCLNRTIMGIFQRIMLSQNG